MRNLRASGPAPSRRIGHNLFFALQPDEATRERMAAAAQNLKRDLAPQGRWVRPHRYHMTLRFLGQHDVVSDQLLDAALAAGDRVRVASFEFALDIAGSFANRSIPWWLGCRELPSGLAALSSTIATGLPARAGDPDLVAHITVLRDADRGLPITPIEPIAWRATEFVLIDSVLGGIPRHDVLRRWALRS